MRARSVVKHVLDKLKSRYAYRIERLVIRSTRIPHRDCADPKVAQWPNPLLEDPRDRRILLQVNPTNLSSPVIDVEVSRNFRLLRLDHDGPCWFSQEIRQLQLIRSFR